MQMQLRSTPTDGFPTPTSKAQAETEHILRSHIPDPHKGNTNANPNETITTENNDSEAQQKAQQQPVLHRNLHMTFLARNLVQGFPVRYISQDASQPWLLFWTVQAFSVMQVAMDPANRQRIIEKVMSWQHPDGGFGGGPGQAAHLLPTYASVSILAIVGRPGPDGGWDQIDREKVYKFFMSVKQNDGSFLVAHHSEVDVRGIYCLLTVASLLNILTPELVEGTASFLASCQTYEGGFASASHPSYALNGSLLSSPRPPLGEAHGGYTFCALASWVLLQPFIEQSKENLKPSIDLKTLLRWLVHMQGSEIELGGFKGRTNKLVDGCYSWWCGGSFALLEALGVGGIQNANSEEVPIDGGAGDAVWDDVDDGLYNRHALQEYILYAGQHPTGGLRDKPPKNADAYHTLYCLSGLSSAQHHVFPSHVRKDQIARAWKSSDKSRDEHDDDLRREIFSSLLSWSEEEGASHIFGGTSNRLNATHPLTNLTITHSEAIAAHFYGQELPQKHISSRPPPPPPPTAAVP